MPTDDEIYLCDLCHDAIGVKPVDYFWLCLQCAEQYLMQISRERWKR